MSRDPVQPLSPLRAFPTRALRMSVALGLAAVACLALASAPAHAEGRIQKLRGHLGIGYAKLLGGDTPGGSFSMGAGVDYPAGSRLRVGLAFGYDLLGGRTVERGSFAAGLDYSMIELLAYAHWAPQMLGPLRRISLGGGLFSARADLSASAGGAGFSDLAVDEVAPGFALDGTLLRSHDSPVRLGIEVGGRFVFLKDDTWTMGLIRLAFHY